ncbi:MAG: flagellar hook-length control protein FliK, partial [Gammaproteobacteria bacterium]|nr:flagellar hook-length control protein FliK [Gammaproteobacteria bacterium]
VEGVASPVPDPLDGLVEPSLEALGMDGEDILPVVTLQPVVAGAATSVPTPTSVSLSLATSVPAPVAQALAMLEAEPTTLELDPGGEGDSEFDGLLGLARQGRLDTRSPSAVLTQYTTRVETPLQQPNWSDHFAGKLAWLANQRIQVAEIHINPQDLGPVEVRIQMQQDQASIVVHSPHPTVRELLESQGHRLRDMLQQNGVELAQLDVSDQSTRQQAGQQGDGHGQGGAHSGSADGDALGLLTGGEGGVLQSGEGLVRDLTRVDLFV